MFGIFNTKSGLLFVFGAGLTIGVCVMTYWPGIARMAGVAEKAGMPGWSDDHRKWVARVDARLSESRLLASKLALLEARLARVDALGKSLVMAHDLSATEFNFDERPGVGGTGELDPLDQLYEDVLRREADLRLLKDLLNGNKRRQQTFPSGWPVENGWVTSGYGRRLNPFTRLPEIHKGLDIAGREGSEIYAVASGVVTRESKKARYGLFIEIDHGNGYRTRYAHNQINLVRKGDVVRQGEVIALLGNTGRSTGPHLHFEVLKNGRSVPPRKYLSRR